MFPNYHRKNNEFRNRTVNVGILPTTCVNPKMWLVVSTPIIESVSFTNNPHKVKIEILILTTMFWRIKILKQIQCHCRKFLDILRNPFSINCIVIKEVLVILVCRLGNSTVETKGIFRRRANYRWTLTLHSSRVE